MPAHPSVDIAPRPGVRTFTPRWRRSPLTEERIRTLLPGRRIPDGPLDPARAFARTAPVVVEIGSGHGAAAIAYAAGHPEVDVLAVEVHVPGVARMLARADTLALGNLWVECTDALPLLQHRIAPGSLSAVHLFFPDPWPKKRHAKRRFVQHHSLALIAERLAPGGRLLIATDHPGHARHVLAQLDAHGGWDVVEGERPSWRPTDGFEDKALRAGRAIHEFRCARAG